MSVENVQDFQYRLSTQFVPYLWLRGRGGARFNPRTHKVFRQPKTPRGGGYHPPWILVFPSEFFGNIFHGYVFGVKESNGDNEKIPSLLYDLENQGQTPFGMTYHISGCKHDKKLILVSILTF